MKNEKLVDVMIIAGEVTVLCWQHYLSHESLTKIRVCDQDSSCVEKEVHGLFENSAAVEMKA